MSNIYGHEQMGFQGLLGPLGPEIDSFRERWADKSLNDIYREMPISERIETDVNHSVETVTLEAVDGERDDTSIVWALPYLNGWTPHHYIRARAMQELAFPNSQVVVLPAESDSVSITDEDRRTLAMGYGHSIAEQQMKALETLDLGVVALSGYSWGATTAVELTNIGSDRLEVRGLNIDELPSAAGRSAKELKKDFMKSGSIFALRASVREAEIPALSQAMSIPRMALDLARFGIRSQSKDSKLLAETMTKSAGVRIAKAVKQAGPANSKVGYIKGSRIFNPISAWITQHYKDARIVEYGGRGFHGHASADNVILHAAMVYDGLRTDS